MNRQEQIDCLREIALHEGFKLHHAHLMSIAAENMNRGNLNNAIATLFTWINERESA